MRTVIIILFLYLPNVYADTCVNVNGMAGVVAGDHASAKLEALARAKWQAIEEVVGVQVQVASLVQNFALMDENIIKKTSGIVRGHKILNESVSNGVYEVSINVCVSRIAAEKTVGLLSRKTAVGVFVLSSSKKEGEYAHGFSEVQNIDRDPFSVAVKQGLVEQDIQVVDIATVLEINAENLSRELKQGKVDSVRKIMTKSMANMFVFGQIENIISTQKGADIGYGLSMPLYKVTSRLNYKILSRESGGLVKVIRSGSEQSIGMALSLSDANQQAMEKLASIAGSPVVRSIHKLIDGKASVIDLRISNVSDIDTHELIKDKLNQIQWAMEVKDIGTGHFKIKYLEQVLYLANSLQRLENINITGFTDLTITGKHQ